MDPVIKPAWELCVGSNDCLAASCPSGGDLLGVIKRVSPAEGKTAGALLLRPEREVETEGQSCKGPPLSRGAQSLISQVRRQRPREEQELAQGHTAG